MGLCFQGTVSLTFLRAHKHDFALKLQSKQELAISAIFKKGCRKKAGHYRPVSLTSIICKCMEHCVKDRIVNHMTTNKLFSTQLFGFIKGRSTVLQLLNVIESWIKTLDRG